jgi:hypothetical protein
MATAAPRSLSVYRGQSRTGKGEGPGRTVLHGEQYLWVEPELYTTELLDVIRPWMTLDADAADHQRLNDQLEAWSLFPYGDYLFVVRLVSAGTYDRRAAYFSHGRAWQLNSLPRGFDAGLEIGRSETFDEPWRDKDPDARVSAPPALPPVLVRPEQIKAEAETAAVLLGHLFQALAGDYPLILAVPVKDFRSGDPLHALVCFARGGLPAHLRDRCRIRVYSRLPDLFLRQLGASFVVVPEDTAGDALSARPNGTLLDRQGRKLAGKDLDDRALAYAKAVVERATGIPDGLPFFSERFSRRFGREDLPAPEDIHGIQITYNLAFALAGDRERQAGFLRQYLPRAVQRFGPGLGWGRLIGNEEWSTFPQEALLDRLLSDAQDLSPAELEFLRAVEDAASQLGLRVDTRLADWWDPGDPARLHRLLELLTHAPPLVSEEAAAERTAQIPLERLVETGPLYGVLGAEEKSGLLARRASESVALARAAREPKTFEVLSRAVSKGAVDPTWARVYIGAAAPEELVAAARQWLLDPDFLQKWGDVPKKLLDGLRSREPAPSGLSTFLISAGMKLEPVANLEVYLRLADLVARIDRDEGSEKENALVAKLWKELPRITDPRSREYLLGIVFDPDWLCLRTASTVVLLELAAGLQRAESYDQLYGALDQRMRQDPEAATDELARTGWWYFWRRRSRLAAAEPEVARRSATAWLASDVWTDWMGSEATLEAWKQALADLPAKLSGPEMARLRGDMGKRRWPWIPPFEEEQLDALIGRAEDLGALAELAEALRSDESVLSAGTAAHDYILPRSRYAANLPSGALGWLLEGRYGSQLPTLSLEHSAFLYQQAGHRTERALEARVRAVANHLAQSPGEALKAAGEPYLWSHGGFLSTVGEWMNRQGSLFEIGRGPAAWIDEHVDGEPAPLVRSPSRKLVEDLVEAGLNHAARLLQKELQEEVQKENLIDKVIQALSTARSKDPCWLKLAERVTQVQSVDDPSAGRHPLALLAERIRSAMDLSREERRLLASSGWRTFELAAHQNPSLMKLPPHQAMGLPQFDLAASLLGPGALGNAILQVVFTAANRSLRDDHKWWRRLLIAMRDFRWYRGAASVDDRPSVALALVFEHLDALATSEQNALLTALRLEAKENPEWTLPSEFGVRRL